MVQTNLLIGYCLYLRDGGDEGDRMLEKYRTPYFLCNQLESNNNNVNLPISLDFLYQGKVLLKWVQIASRNYEPINLLMKLSRKSESVDSRNPSGMVMG